MFDEKPFKMLIESIKNTPLEDFPVASFMNVEGLDFPVFTNRVYKDGSHLHHAEILAINQALKQLKIMDFKGLNAILYSSLEPCCMCLSFASLVRVSRVIFYAEEAKFGGVKRIFTQNSSFTKPEILFIEKEELKPIMSNFFKQKR
jgi:tRNA(Arg) A34 adenosine deaminase TadA